MKPVPLYKAKARLSELVERALAGEPVVISRGGQPAVRLVPVEQPQTGRRFGALHGVMEVDAAFFEPLPEEELAAWEARA